MRRRVWTFLALGLALCAAPAAADSTLGRRLDAALGARALRGARSAAFVVARENGRVLYARDPDRRLVPASNQKILTAVAVLDAWGPTHRFVTQVFADAPPDAEGSVEWLAVRGGGDPALTSEEVWRLGAELRQLGVRRVRQGLVLDDSAFDGERWHPSWGPLSTRAYHAPVGALSVNYGAFAVSVTPGPRAGEPVRVALEPPVPFFRLANRATTGPASGRHALEVERAAAGELEQVTVSGVARAGGETQSYYRSVLDPARYAGSVIRMQLEANGVAVGAESRLGPVPEDATLLLSFEGKPLAEIVRLFLKFSNNAIGEGLVKALGVRQGDGPGDWARGMAALRHQLASAGLDGVGVTLVDGSGLSYANLVSPRVLVRALRFGANSFRFGPEFLAALPIAAMDGTLEERAEGVAHAVRAKTGLLTRVTALSGFAQRANGQVVVFSLLVNGYRGSAEAAMAAVDDFVAALVSAPTSVGRSVP